MIRIKIMSISEILRRASPASGFNLENIRADSRHSRALPISDSRFSNDSTVQRLAVVARESDFIPDVQGMKR